MRKRRREGRVKGNISPTLNILKNLFYFLKHGSCFELDSRRQSNLCNNVGRDN